MGARRVISPLAAGVTSALGCLTAPLSFEEVRSLPSSLEGADWDEVNGVYREMERQAVRLLAQAGTPEDGVTLARSADMRLSGQIHEINVPIPAGELGAGQLERIQADFHDIYEELYSRRNLNIPIEVQNWRLLATGPEPVVRLSRQDVDEGADAGAALKGTRRAYFQGAGFIECPVYDRYRLAPGARLTGPAIVEEQESTAVLGMQDRAEVDEWFNLVFEVGGAAQA
jgi:N-methylhydantoinase A/oxoprolinase/acetone carboxylase beta subunit